MATTVPDTIEQLAVLRSKTSFELGFLYKELVCYDFFGTEASYLKLYNQLSSRSDRIAAHDGENTFFMSLVEITLHDKIMRF